MEKKKDTKKTPLWGWSFGLICLTIPVLAIGLVIPAILGGVGFISCYKISQNEEEDQTGRVIRCSVVTALCWALFGGFYFINKINPSEASSESLVEVEVEAMQTDLQPETTQELKVLTPEAEQKIYAQILQKRESITAKEGEIKSRLAEGLSTDLHLEELVQRQVSYRNYLEFTAKSQKITPEKLQEIIARGDAGDWPSVE